MSRLDDLYKAIETMRREHLSTADLEAWDSGTGECPNYLTELSHTAI